MNKKGSFDIQNYLISILLVIGIMVTFGTSAVNMGDNYETIGGGQVDPAFIDTYNKLDEIEDETDKIQQKVLETDTGTTDADSQFLGDALNSLKLIVPSMTASLSMISSMAVQLGVPLIWQRLAFSILIVMIVTTIIFMVFKSTGKT